MSMLLMVKAMQIKVGNPFRKLVLIKLADNANDHGECWPSHQHIADQCEMSRRSVINHINKLEEMGFIRRERRVKNNEKQSNLYYLTLDDKIKIGSAGDSLPSETGALGSAGGALGGSERDAHRTSHSSEPVNEPNNVCGEESKKNSCNEKQSDYSESFEMWWSIYPKVRRNNKKGCYRVWVREKLEDRADEVISKLKQQVAFDYKYLESETYIPLSSSYINQNRYDNEVLDRRPRNAGHPNNNQPTDRATERHRQLQAEWDKLQQQPDN